MTSGRKATSPPSLKKGAGLNKRANMSRRVDEWCILGVIMITVFFHLFPHLSCFLFLYRFHSLHHPPHSSFLFLPQCYNPHTAAGRSSVEYLWTRFNPSSGLPRQTGSRSRDESPSSQPPPTSRTHQWSLCASLTCLWCTASADLQ